MSAGADVDVIEPDALSERLANKSVDDKLLLVQVTSPQVYEQAHIAGAALVTPQALVCGVPPATGKLPEKSALRRLVSYFTW